MTEDKLRQVTELLESAIMDFQKLKHFIGNAAEQLANIYTEELKKITQ